MTEFFNSSLGLGFGLALGLYYVIAQLVPIVTLVKYKAYIDATVVALCIALIVKVPTNLVTAMTTWTGLFFSLLLLLTKWRYNKKQKKVI